MSLQSSNNYSFGIFESVVKEYTLDLKDRKLLYDLWKKFSSEKRKLPDWFNTAKQGIFIHWGIYSVSAYDDLSTVISDKGKLKRKIGNGSEWFQNRLLKTWQETKADVSAKKYFKTEFKSKGLDNTASGYKIKDKNLLTEEYYNLKNKLTGENFNIDVWINLFKKVDAKYIVFTAKHHDGFCMWNTKTTKNNIMNTPMKRDVLQELSDACKKNNIKFGIYYSWMEFTSNITFKYMEKVRAQILELEEYEPDLFWFDGDWKGSYDGPEKSMRVKEIVKRLHSNSIIVNNRLGKGKPEVGSSIYAGDYDNFEDRCIPDSKQEQRYEHCNTIGLGWGYNKQQAESKEKDTVGRIKYYKSKMN